jgi:hypothetical protein
MILRIVSILSLLANIGFAEIRDPELRKILHQYRATLLSESHPEGLQTLVIQGTSQNVGGIENQIEILRKSPNKIRIETIQKNGITVMVGFNGTAGWGRIEDHRRVHHTGQEAKGSIDWLRFHSNFENHLLRALKNDETIQVTRLPDYQVPGSDLVFRVVEAKDASDIRFTYYLNTTTDGLDRIRIETKSESDPIIELHYAQQRRIEGFLLPHHVEFYQDGVLLSFENYRKITVNKFLNNFLFERPGY